MNQSNHSPALKALPSNNISYYYYYHYLPPDTKPPVDVIISFVNLNHSSSEPLSCFWLMSLTGPHTQTDADSSSTTFPQLILPLPFSLPLL